MHGARPPSPPPGVLLHVRARFSDLHVKSMAAGLPLPTSRADLEPPKGMWLRVGLGRVRVRSGVGLIWAPNMSFCENLHIVGSFHT